MSSLPRRRRIKRPTILAKRSQLAKNDLFKKRSYKPLYEQLKTNNNALAKALSNEKQETKYLYTQNIELTSQLQELGVACNRRDDIISGVMKNAKETLQLMVTLSSYVTNTIASCQQVVTTTRYTPRKSTSNNRRDSTRRLSGKSPARGVVQPMVSGHTITKPTINLSRLNIQRQYRVQNPPNLADIEEVPSPAQSPVAAQPTNSGRIPIARSLNYGTRRVNRLPERFQGSIGASDESERRSSARSNRNSNRHSARRSRRSSETLLDDTTPRRSTSESQASERLRSPRVALHDVSRLLQNSQSVNIRTLLENSSDMDMTQGSQRTDQVPETSSSNTQEPEQIIAESSDEPESDGNVTAVVPEPSKPKIVSKKSKTSYLHDDYDPKEGPSWLLNAFETASSSTEDEQSTTVNDLTRHQNTKEHTKRSKPTISEADEGDKRKEDEEQEEKDQEEEEEEEEKEKTPGVGQNDEKTAKISPTWPKPRLNFYHNLLDEDDRTTNLARFVTRNRGSVDDDDLDEYTLLWKKPGPPENYKFDLNDFDLPILESPIVAAVEPPIPEPDVTTNIQRINQTFDNRFTPTFSRANVEDTFFDDTGLMLPRITKKLETPKATSAVVEQEEQSDDEEVVPRKRKRKFNRKAIVDSDSDSDWVSNSKKTTDKLKKKNSKTKDPSSAKVVLQKLAETHVKKRSPSPETRLTLDSERQRRSSSTSLQPDGSSDSEGSNASSTAKSAPSRPTRHKAPKNLQEPSLRKKMRRK